MFRCLLLAALILLPVNALADRPPAVVPRDAATVIERLPRGYAALVPVASNRPVPMAQVQRLLATAARSGDARLAARAAGLLDRFPATDHSPELLRARAYTAQHRHDFLAALKLLDTLVSSQPRDGDARLSRAQIHLVQGRLDLARADCAALAFGVDSGRALLCVAALSLRTGELPAATTTADRWLGQAAVGDDARRYVLVMRAEIASRAGAADADTWFGRALALAPDDVRTLAAYSRHLRGAGRNADALRLLANAPNSDGLQLERTLAAHAGHAPEAAALALAQARRYQLAHALGSQPEMRDEAEFLLSVRGDALAALALAQKNFEQQRDFEDVGLLQRAALAAKRPEALDNLRVWAASQHLPLAPDPGVRK